jgi:hypothetical protein
MRNLTVALLMICVVALALTPAAQATGKRIHKAFSDIGIIHPIPDLGLVRCQYGPGHPPLYPPIKYCSG